MCARGGGAAGLRVLRRGRGESAAGCTGGCGGKKRRRKKAAVDLGCVRVRLRRGAAAVGAAEQRRDCSCCCLCGCCLLLRQRKKEVQPAGVLDLEQEEPGLDCWSVLLLLLLLSKSC